MDDDNDTILFMVGKTGNGKSSTGNAILNDNFFPTSSNAQSLTSAIKLGGFTRHDSSVLKVIDTPGLLDTQMSTTQSNDKLEESIAKALTQCPDGFDAILLILKYGCKFGSDEDLVVRVLKHFLGDLFVKKHCILIFTYGEQIDLDNKHNKSNQTFTQWLEKQTGTLGDLIRECNKRCVLFRNLTKPAYDEQRDKLLEQVAALPRPFTRYTHDIFMRVKEKRDEIIREKRALILMPRFHKQIELLKDSKRKAKRSIDEGRKLDQIFSLLEFIEQDSMRLKDEIKNADPGLKRLRPIHVSVMGILHSMLQMKHELKANGKVAQDTMTEFDRMSLTLEKQLMAKLASREIQTAMREIEQVDDLVMTQLRLSPAALEAQ